MTKTKKLVSLLLTLCMLLSIIPIMATTASAEVAGGPCPDCGSPLEWYDSGTEHYLCCNNYSCLYTNWDTYHSNGQGSALGCTCGDCASGGTGDNPGGTGDNPGGNYSAGDYCPITSDCSGTLRWISLDGYAHVLECDVCGRSIDSSYHENGAGSSLGCTLENCGGEENPGDEEYDIKYSEIRSNGSGWAYPVGTRIYMDVWPQANNSDSDKILFDTFDAAVYYKYITGEYDKKEAYFYGLYIDKNSVITLENTYTTSFGISGYLGEEKTVLSGGYWIFNLDNGSSDAFYGITSTGNSGSITPDKDKTFGVADPVCYIDLETSETYPNSTTIDQNYNLTVTDGGYTDVTKVKLEWMVNDITASRTDNKTWDPDTLTWTTDTATDDDVSITANGTATFTLTNLSSVKVNATASFAAAGSFAPASVSFTKDSAALTSTKASDSHTYTTNAVTIGTAVKDDKSVDTSIDHDVVIGAAVTPSKADFHTAPAATGAKYGTYTVTITAA